MADVLTQSQIDALIGMAKNNAEEPKETEESVDNRRVRKYDFYSPKKINKQRLKLLDGIYESYARTLSSYITSLLRLTCTVELLSIEEQRYYEFNNALGENDILALVDMQLKGEESDSHFLFQMSNPISFAMIDRLMGGQGEYDESDTNGYTEIELGVYESIAKRVSLLAKDAWSNYMEVGFEYRRYESNPRLVQTISYDEIVVIIVLSVTIKDTVGTINVCMPSDILTRFFDLFEKESQNTNQSKKADGKSSVNDIIHNLKSSDLELRVNMGSAYILMSDLFNMQPGDVINLNKSKEDDVYLAIEDRQWFKGKLGIYKQNKAVKLTGTCENISDIIGGEV